MAGCEMLQQEELVGCFLAPEEWGKWAHLGWLPASWRLLISLILTPHPISIRKYTMTRQASIARYLAGPIARN
jgi:hypothetical protein